MNKQTPVAKKMPLWKVICVRTKALFLASGKTMKEFSGDLGIGRSTATGWFTGRSAPRMENVDNIAAYFRVPRKCLQCDDGDTVCPSCTPQRRPPLPRDGEPKS